MGRKCALTAFSSWQAKIFSDNRCETHPEAVSYLCAGKIDARHFVVKGCCATSGLCSRENRCGSADVIDNVQGFDLKRSRASKRGKARDESGEKHRRFRDGFVGRHVAIAQAGTMHSF